MTTCFTWFITQASSRTAGSVAVLFAETRELKFKVWQKHLQYVIKEPVRDQVTSVPHYKHITHISLCEPGGQHPRVYARDKNSSGDGVVPHFLKLLYHVPLLVHPVLHDAM